MHSKPLKVCFFSPYVPGHQGGGEKFLFDCIRALGDEYQVDIALSTKILAEKNLSLDQAKQQYLSQERFAGLDHLNWITTPLFSNASFWQKLNWTRQWDVLYYVTDGSIFWSLAKQNILHIQVPFLINKSSFLEQLKLGNWQVKNTNSEFTKSVVTQAWPVKIEYVHHPMVVPPSLPNLKKIQKEKIILNVGRFFRQLHSKKQDVLVQFFKKLKSDYPQESKGWKLVLLGPVEDETYAAAVAELAQGLDVEIHHDVSQKELWSWYQRSSIYWHASGYGVDQSISPEKMEHFGISTVEAMTQGCVPIVIGLGGQPEVVGDELQQLLWLNEAECLDHTVEVITNPDLQLQLGLKAQEQSQHFNVQEFTKILELMVKGKS